MGRIRIIMLVAFVLVMSAGVVVGRLWARLPVETRPQGRSPSWLADQLQLSSDQRQQMDAIWNDTKQQIGALMDHRRGLDREREQAIRNLLTPDQRTAYDKINDDFRARRSDLDKQREALLRQANERSRALLTETQQKRWDTLTKEMHDHDHDRRGQHGPPGLRPTTKPAAQNTEGSRP